MRYNSKKHNEKQAAIEYFNKLLNEECRFELKKIHPKRSLSQNAYLHVLFSLYGLEVGTTIEETKTDIKRALNYVYEKNGSKYLIQTRSMDSKEMTIFIDKFVMLAANQGIELPSPSGVTDTLLNYIEQNKQWL